MAQIQSVSRYEKGTNEYLDRVLDTENLWIVQGSLGRRPVIAENEAQARECYLNVAAPAFEKD